MIYRATYAGLTELKKYQGITVTTDDATLRAILERVSEAIDNHCYRKFGVVVETRYYTAVQSDTLLLDRDLLSVSALKADGDGDRTYEDSWLVTDYDLLPFNGYPKTCILTSPDGNYSFPSTKKGVEIAGTWGYGNGQSATPYDDSTTTTAEELDATETGVDVASGAALAIGQTILIESEQMYITGISTNTLTVERGVNGTTAATHATGKAIYIYRYPGNVVQACLLMAEKMWARKDAPFGIVGAPETGQIRITGADRDVVAMLSPYVDWGGGIA